MNLQEFLVKIGLSEFSFWGILLFLTTIGIELTPKIKWNPWTALFKWIGTKFNTHIDTKLDTVREEIKAVDKKVTDVQMELLKHISESESKALADMRRDILDFANACMNGRKHTQEQYKFMLKKCNTYKKYVKENNIENGEIENAIDEIKRLHKERLQKNDFLREGEDPEEHIRRSIIDEFIAGIHKYQDACPARSEKMAEMAFEKAKAARSRKTVNPKQAEKEEKREANA